MRSAVAKALRGQFEKRLKQELPGFTPVKGADIPAGDRLYQRALGDKLTLYVLLEAHHLEDWFNISLAWSEKNRWPARLVGLSPGDPPREGEMRFRFRDLWENVSIGRWWEIVPPPETDAGYIERALNPLPVEDALAKVPPFVEDAIQHLRNEGWTYFKSVAEEHGFRLEP